MIDIPITLRMRVYQGFHEKAADQRVPREQVENYLAQQEHDNRKLGEILARMARSLGMKAE